MCFQPSNIVVPPLFGHRLTLANTDSSGITLSTLILIPPGTTEHTFAGLSTEGTYTVTIVGINSVGFGSPSGKMIDNYLDFLMMMTQF